MAEQTGLANNIDTADQEAQYDDCVKKLLSNRLVLAWIMKECVTEFKSYSITQIAKDCIEGEPQVSKIAVDQDVLNKYDIEYLEEMSDKSIEGNNTEDNSIKEGKVFYDIKFSAVVPDLKKPVQLFINVEAQKDDSTPYPLIKRALYYVSRMISAQKNTVFTKKHYEKIRKVYSIWIQLDVAESKRNTITKYHITEEQVIGNVPEKESNYDLISVLMLRLGPADEANDKPILRLLDVLLSAEIKPNEKKAILEKDFDIPMTKLMSEEANIMCNLGEGIRERTEVNTKTQSIINLMDTTGKEIDEVMKLLKIEPKEYDKYRENVENMLVLK